MLYASSKIQPISMESNMELECLYLASDLSIVMRKVSEDSPLYQRIGLAIFPDKSSVLDHMTLMDLGLV
jgi:hypothetical protein